MILNVEEIVSEIRKNREFRYRPTDYLIENGIPLSCHLEVIKALYEKHGNEYVSEITRHLFLQASAEKSYIDFLVYTALKNDLALFSCPFKKIADASFDLGLDIYNHIKESSVSNLKQASGILLYYLGRVSPNLIFEEIKINLGTADTSKKIALVSALQDVSPWRNDTLPMPTYVIDFVAQCAVHTDELLKRIAVKTAIIRYDLNKEKFQNPILSFIRESDTNKILVCQIIEPDNCPDPEFDLEIIKECSDSNSSNVIQYLLRMMGGKLHSESIHKEKLIAHILAMIRKWSMVPGFNNFETGFMINSVGKIDTNSPMEFIERWVREESNEIILTFIIPKIIYELFEDDEEKLIDRISSWRDTDDRFRQLWFRTLKETLDEIYNFSNHQFNIADINISKSISFAAETGINVDSFREYISDKSIDIRTELTLLLLERVSIKGTDENKNSLLKSHKNDLTTFLSKYKTKDNTLKLIQNSLTEVGSRSYVDLNEVEKLYDKSFASKIIKCASLIEAILKEKRSINPELVMSNLRFFPNLTKYLGTDWFKEKSSDPNPLHDLILLLSKMDISPDFLKKLESRIIGNEHAQNREIEKWYYLKLRLEYVDNCLNVLKTVKNGKEKLLNRLKNDDEYNQTFSELEVAMAMSKSYSISPQEKINGRPVDILASDLDNQLVIEVTSLTEISKLKLMGIVPNMKNKVKSILLDKIARQVSHIMSSDIPLVVAIDKTRAHEIDFDDLYSSLYGSVGIEVLKDKNNMDDPLTIRLVRMADSINNETEFAKGLSGVIMYYSEVSLSEKRVKLIGDVIRNPKARIPLTEKDLEQIKVCMFKG